MIFKLLKYWLSLYYWDHVSLESVKKMQLKKFRKIFEYARENSKFYKDLYSKHGLMDLKIESYEDIEKVPIVTKSMLREYKFEDILTCKINSNINVHSTSGSSGEPFKIAFKKFEDYTSHVRLTTNLMKFGYSPFKKMVLISRYELGHKFEVEEDLNFVKYIQKKIGLFQREVISIFEPVDIIIEKLKKIKPFIIWSTPTMMHFIANELEKRNDRINIPLIFFMSETISDNQIELFRNRLCENFIDVYGMMESPCIGYSYNNTTYKKSIVNSVLVEVINKRVFNDDEIGDVIVTNLYNSVMPFIRYSTGDYAGVLRGKDFPVKKIGKILGRFDDMITLNDGKVILYHQIYQLFADFHECEKYKLLQLENGNIVLQLKIKHKADQSDVKNIALQRWNSRFSEYPINVEFVEDFSIDPKTGKFKLLERLKS